MARPMAFQSIGERGVAVGDGAAGPPLGFRPSLHVSGVPGREDPVNLARIGDVGQDNPFVPMLTRTSQLIGQRGCKNRYETGCWLPRVSVEYLPLTPIHRASTPPPQAFARPPAATADQVATWSWFATAESTGRPR